MEEIFDIHTHYNVEMFNEKGQTLEIKGATIKHSQEDNDQYLLIIGKEKLLSIRITKTDT